MIKCQYCDSLNDNDATECKCCGARDFYYICPACGNVSENIICRKCGRSFNLKTGSDFGGYTYKSQDGNSGSYTYKPQGKSSEGSAYSAPNEDYESRRSYRQTAEKGKISPKSRTVTLLFAIFAGYLGGHYFYTGRIGKGILYLFTCGLFYIGWIYDIIKIARNRFVDSEGRIICR